MQLRNHSLQRAKDKHIHHFTNTKWKCLFNGSTLFNTYCPNNSTQKVHSSVVTYAWMCLYIAITKTQIFCLGGDLLVSISREHDLKSMHKSVRSSGYQPTHGWNDWMAQKCPSTTLVLLFRPCYSNLLHTYALCSSQTYFSRYPRFPGSYYTFLMSPFPYILSALLRF